MTDDERLKIVERHVAELAEIYDAVQVVGTWLTLDGYTKSHKRGSGNWYARQQMAREFIEENVADENAKSIARHLDPPDDTWKQST